MRGGDSASLRPFSAASCSRLLRTSSRRRMNCSPICRRSRSCLPPCGCSTRPARAMPSCRASSTPWRYKRGSPHFFLSSTSLWTPSFPRRRFGAWRFCSPGLRSPLAHISFGYGGTTDLSFTPLSRPGELSPSGRRRSLPVFTGKPCSRFSPTACGCFSELESCCRSRTGQCSVVPARMGGG